MEKLIFYKMIFYYDFLVERVGVLEQRCHHIL